jgi:phosphotransferase system  glucose/maltose/N-acetylglucosamine-specific IIC component
MNNNLVIALLCGVVSMFLSVTMPCLLKKVNTPMLHNVKTVFNNNKHLILVSSLVVSVTAYLALLLYPLVAQDISSGERMSANMMMKLLGKKH